MQQSNTENRISAAALDRLIAAHDGDVALLYLYWLRRGSVDAEQAAAALCRTRREIAAAEEKLRRMGLPDMETLPSPAAQGSRPPVFPPEDAPQHTAEDLTRRSQEDAVFSAILNETRRVMGRNLSSNDEKLLFDIYDYLGLPPEVVFMLLNHCAELFRERYGESRRPTALFIRTQAYEWARQEVLTIEQAEAFICAQKERSSELEQIKAVLNIYGRELTKTEKDYLNAWLDLGFHKDAIAIAYDRTVTQTNALKWSYMNKIFLSWNKMGLHTAKEIEEKDPRGAAQRRGAAGGDKPVDMDALRRIIDKI